MTVTYQAPGMCSSRARFKRNHVNYRDCEIWKSLYRKPGSVVQREKNTRNGARPCRIVRGPYVPPQTPHYKQTRRRLWPPRSLPDVLPVFAPLIRSHRFSAAAAAFDSFSRVQGAFPCSKMETIYRSETGIPAHRRKEREHR